MLLLLLLWLLICISGRLRPHGLQMPSKSRLPSSILLHQVLLGLLRLMIRLMLLLLELLRWWLTEIERIRASRHRPLH